jgi:hypothetical protein
LLLLLLFGKRKNEVLGDVSSSEKDENVADEVDQHR